MKFETPFATAPKVALALAGVDADRATNLRLSIKAYDVEADEFSIRISTWDDTLVYAVWVAWIAHEQRQAPAAAGRRASRPLARLAGCRKSPCRSSSCGKSPAARSTRTRCRQGSELGLDNRPHR